jgi:hypothetical protein
MKQVNLRSRIDAQQDFYYSKCSSKCPKEKKLKANQGSAELYVDKAHAPYAYHYQLALFWRDCFCAE